MKRQTLLGAALTALQITVCFAQAAAASQHCPTQDKNNSLSAKPERAGSTLLYERASVIVGKKSYSNCINNSSTYLGYMCDGLFATATEITYKDGTRKPVKIESITGGVTSCQTPSGEKPYEWTSINGIIGGTREVFRLMIYRPLNTAGM